MEQAELIEEARKVFAGPIAFLKSAPDLKFLPDMAVKVTFLANKAGAATGATATAEK